MARGLAAPWASRAAGLQRRAAGAAAAALHAPLPPRPLPAARAAAVAAGGRRSSSSSGSSCLPVIRQQQQQQQRGGLVAGPVGRPLSSSAVVAAAATPTTTAPDGTTTTTSPEPFTITTPLYYVNAAPHMGSAYPTIAADVLARYQRLRGRRVRFLTGTDEHGEKIAAAAAARGLSPQAHCDDVVAAYQRLWRELDVRPDGFVRTTGKQHEALVGEVLRRVWDRGDIYKARYEGWYCVDCEEYKDEQELVEVAGAAPAGSSGGDGAQPAAAARTCCPTHRKPCQHRSEENYFFALSRYQERLAALLEGNEGFVQPAARRNEVLGWVRDGVRDFSISRAACSWGIPLPQDLTHTVYVWFDALNGYLSGLAPLADGSSDSDSSSGGEGAGGEGALAGSSGGGEGAGGEGEGAGALRAALAQGWPADVHVIGKDILRFHAIYWPGMLMSAGLPLPKAVFGHGFLTKDGLKMGKALGNTLDPAALVGAYGPDAVRLFFMKEVAFGQDGNFSEAAFRDTVNATLANSVGNLVNRTLGLLRKNYAGVLPVSAADALTASPSASAAAGPAAAAGEEAAAAAPGEQQQQQRHPLQAAADEGVAAAAAAYARLAPHQAVEAVLGISAAGNLYLEQTAPWTALKKGSDEEKAAAGAALVAVLEAARIIAVALSPVTPRLCARVYQQLGLGGEPLEGRVDWEEGTRWGQLAAGHQTAEPQPVFARLDDAVPFVTEPAPSSGGGAAAAGGGGGGKKNKAAAANNGGGGGKKQKQQKQQQQPKQEEASKQQAAAAANVGSSS